MVTFSADSILTMTIFVEFIATSHTSDKCLETFFFFFTLVTFLLIIKTFKVLVLIFFVC